MTLAASIDDRRALIRRGRTPLVGHVSLRNTLVLTNVGDAMRVEVGSGTRVLLASMAALFGPGLVLLFVWSPERFEQMPLFIRGVVVAVILGMTLLLVRTLLRRPRFDVHANGDIAVRDPEMTIRRGDIRGVRIETDMYSSPPKIFVPNAVLVVATTSDEIRLCASPDTQLIETLGRRIASLARTDLTHAG